ncbi:MAG: polyphosphate polymerase domain-containing protein [Firmicutes bacterium]|nr:polyphosphate polymerase domain-containing protein [Bacillota bacterium]MBR6025263.1 polyphosphate polymerase domain-containing protein [Bacillota bacterium]
MSEIQSCFRRYENKYLLSRAQYEAMKKGMAPYMRPDEYSNYTICNIYYDTPEWELIRTSLMKPVYKEKLRMRSYGCVNNSDNVFIEIKKKYDGVVYKRRVTMKAIDADRFIRGEKPEGEGQIHREIEYFLDLYRPEPKVFIAYDREAYAGKENSELRITFDTNLRYREDNVDLRAGDYGRLILPEEKILMEIKIPGTAPLFLAKLLSENNIFPTSFSKYGTYFSNVVLKGIQGSEYKQEVRKSA